MATTRFKGDSGSDRLGVSTISDSDMIQVRHKPGTVDDSDKGVSKAVLTSCPLGVSSTAAATAAKTAALTDSNPDFTLLSGREVVVYFSTANSAASPTLNFAGSGTNPIYYPDGTAVGAWDAGTWMHLKYFEATIDNTLIQRWICISPVLASTISSGEHRPPTSGAVASAMSYSTAETFTGKYWIDGKPIYRKAGHLDSISSGHVVLDSSLTTSVVDAIINTGGCVIDPSGTLLGGMAYSSADYRLSLGCNSSGLFKLDVYSGTYTNFNWWVEYTKK